MVLLPFIPDPAAMAEPTSSASAPALPSTADSIPYVPVSWLAVAAASTSSLLAALLLGLGLHSIFKSHRPLLEEELLILAVVAIVLSFAARRVIQNSEGTRTGILFGVDLPKQAWWTALILGLGYGTYLFAIDFSIKRDAEKEVQTWTGYILKGDSESLTRAFHRTQDPSQRQKIRPDDRELMEKRWGKEYTGFLQCDFLRIVNRNPDSKFDLGGLRDWAFKPTGVECLFTATLTNSEGTFPIQIPLKGIESSTGAEGGRQWQVINSPAGYIMKETSRLTPYGWYVHYLTFSGGEKGKEFIQICSNRELRPYAFLDFADAKTEDRGVLQPLTVNAQRGRSALMGFAANTAWRPGPEIYNFTADRLFRLPANANPSDEQKKIFRDAWNTTGIVKAGERLRENTDTNDLISIRDVSITVNIPIEIPLPSKGDVVAARGKLVVVCDDPSIVAEVKKLRAEANPAEGTNIPPEDFARKPIPWKVQRIESDLKPIKFEQRQLPKPGAMTPPPGGPAEQ